MLFKTLPPFVMLFPNLFLSCLVFLNPSPCFPELLLFFSQTILVAQGNKEADKWIVAKLCFQFLCWFFRQNNYPGMVRRCQSPIWLDRYTTTCEALYDFFNSEFLSVRMDAFPRFNEEVFLRLFNSTTQLKCNKQPVIKTIFFRMLLREAPPKKFQFFGNY